MEQILFECCYLVERSIRSVKEIVAQWLNDRFPYSRSQVVFPRSAITDFSNLFAY